MTDHDSDQRQAEQLEEVLRRLSSWVGAGGLDAEVVDPAQFEERTRWGVNFLLDAQERRRNEIQATVDYLTQQNAALATELQGLKAVNQENIRLLEERYEEILRLRRALDGNHL